MLYLCLGGEAMKLYTFYIDETDLEQVKALSKDTFLSVSEIMRDAVRKHLDRVKNDGIYIRATKR